MRRFVIMLLPLLAACDARIQGTPVSLIAAGLEVGSIVTLGRSIPDIGYSLVTGQDCSVVNLSARGEYCRTEPVPVPLPFCTRSLAGPDCWTVANPFGPQRQITDIPAAPPRVRVGWGPWAREEIVVSAPAR